MPNHVHILLSSLTNKPINNIIGKVKGFTAYQLRKSLRIDEDIWQKGIFDRILRNWDEFEKYVDYIANIFEVPLEQLFVKRELILNHRISKK